MTERERRIEFINHLDELLDLVAIKTLEADRDLTVTDVLIYLSKIKYDDPETMCSDCEKTFFLDCEIDSQYPRFCEDCGDKFRKEEAYLNHKRIISAVKNIKKVTYTYNGKIEKELVRSVNES